MIIEADDGHLRGEHFEELGELGFRAGLDHLLTEVVAEAVLHDLMEEGEDLVEEGFLKFSVALVEFLLEETAAGLISAVDEGVFDECEVGAEVSLAVRDGLSD